MQGTGMADMIGQQVPVGAGEPLNRPKAAQGCLLGICFYLSGLSNRQPSIAQDSFVSSTFLATTS